MPRTPGQGAVAELDVLVEALGLLDRRRDRAVDALGPGGAAETAAGDAHEPARDDDADLGDEVGEEDRGQPARPASRGCRCHRGVGARARHGHKATARVAPVVRAVSRSSGRAGRRGPPPAAPHTTSTAQGPHGQPPSTRAVRRASPSAPEGSAAATSARAPGQLVGRHERAEPEEQHPHEVGEGQHRLGPQRAGHEEGQGDERRAAEEQAHERGQDAGCRGPRAERHPQRPEHDDLDPEHGQHGEGLAREEPAAAEGRGAEQAQHARPPVEPRRDGLAGERRGHHGQRERPGEREVHARARPEVGDRPQRQADQCQGREHERDEQLLAVREQGPGLEGRLGEHPTARCGRGAHRAGPVVREK